MSGLPNSGKKDEYATIKFYTIGFLLSLILTVTAYYLVVHKTVTGTPLLATILVLALLQMAVQIFFFLHLGRGPKPLYNIVFFFHTFVVILVVLLGSVFIMNNLHYSMAPTEVTKKLSQDENIEQIGGEMTGACQQVYTSHKITIQDGKVSPATLEAHLCDAVTFINMDNKVREIAFGPHPTHDSYAGEEVLVRKGRPKTITLNEAGTFSYHDHLDPAVIGYLTVNP